MQLPPHTTHWLQPVDQVAAHLHRRYGATLKKFREERANDKINLFAFCVVFAKIWPTLFDENKVKNAFQRCGITPQGLQKNAITQHLHDTSIPEAQSVAGPTAEATPAIPADLSLEERDAVARQMFPSPDRIPGESEVQYLKRFAKTMRVKCANLVQDLEPARLFDSAGHAPELVRRLDFPVAAFLTSQNCIDTIRDMNAACISKKEQERQEYQRTAVVRIALAVNGLEFPPNKRLTKKILVQLVQSASLEVDVSLPRDELLEQLCLLLGQSSGRASPSIVVSSTVAAIEGVEPMTLDDEIGPCPLPSAASAAPEPSVSMPTLMLRVPVNIASPSGSELDADAEAEDTDDDDDSRQLLPRQDSGQMALSMFRVSSPEMGRQAASAFVPCLNERCSVMIGAYSIQGFQARGPSADKPDHILLRCARPSITASAMFALWNTHKAPAWLQPTAYSHRHNHYLIPSSCVA
eukprot:m.301457 g.301457  ORF g.301457 m.301457 type:complete len:466 (+) comp14783_c0_seq1:1140-2537(+)